MEGGREFKVHICELYLQRMPISRSRASNAACMVSAWEYKTVWVWDSKIYIQLS